MDSLGRFTIKIPLLNTSEVLMDWNITFIRNILEPGETYFLIYDLEKGYKLFMGKNARLQNEILSHPIPWSGLCIEIELSELLEILPRERRRKDSYDKLVKFLA